MKPKQMSVLAALGIMACGILGGCHPQKRVVWAPDGQQAAYLTPAGLHLLQADGKLSELRAPGVTEVAWFADGKRLCAVVQTQAKTWKDVAARLSEAQQRDVRAVAEQLRTAALAHNGDWDKFELPAEVKAHADGLAAALLYLRDVQPEGLREKLGEKWADLEKTAATIYELQIFAVEGGQVLPKMRLHLALEPLCSLRIAPNGSSVLFTAGPEEEALTLWVAPTDVAGAPRQVANWVSLSPDWSADGRYAVYAAAALAKPEGSDAVRLGSISRREIADAQGRLLSEFDKPQDLAGILFHELTRVRCLKDGRILFASSEATLPATAQDMPARPALFAVDPERQPTVTRMLPRSAATSVDEDLTFFEVSPDEKRVAILHNDWTVSVLTLATGTLEVVQERKAKDAKQTATVPAWRSADELCCVAPPAGEKGRVEVVLWSAAGVKGLSSEWTEADVKPLWEAEEEKTEKAPL